MRKINCEHDKEMDGRFLVYEHDCGRSEKKGLLDKGRLIPGILIRKWAFSGSKGREKDVSVKAGLNFMHKSY